MPYNVDTVHVYLTDCVLEVNGNACNKLPWLNALDAGIVKSIIIVNTLTTTIVTPLEDRF